ncbi:Superfamily II DNA or RNA helicase [Methylobacterium sp. 174MFSha1.1]|uniref:DEAD/DEAH box helicase family protein n=1 Tax=Methylobacterium sp. 174MFSha1.1 TaxID=1502749 RepID=UPI0008E38BDB|nr:DEAD/DEAH box helicase family protein [Methylobacterium sp. 174MFSha1.1]SFU78185.1 Superfamily II DNA or RNA helicase [Methylobacterium sp. 174MFSha1.1]
MRALASRTDLSATLERGAAEDGWLDEVRPLYILPHDDFVGQVLIPSFAGAAGVDCMVGFFSSQSLRDIAPGLATFLRGGRKPFRLIVSPFLSPEDQVAIADGTKDVGVVADAVLRDLLLTEDAISQHTLRCLAHLLRTGRLELRIAMLRNSIFHPKVWMFDLGENRTLVAHGSTNFTAAGLKRNYEQVTISRSWLDATQRYIATQLAFQFRQLWEGYDEECIVIPAPRAVADGLLRTLGESDSLPLEDDLRRLYDRASHRKEVRPPPTDEPPHATGGFALPPGLDCWTGDFDHQGRAVDAWVGAGFRGVLEMATGSGKTITSMVCAHRLFEKTDLPLLIVVAAPYVPLVQQWCEEIEPFGIRPTNVTTVHGAGARRAEIQAIGRRLKLGISRVEAIVVSHDLLCSPEFQAMLGSMKGVDRLLVADEAHNLGRESFIARQPEFFEHRLALSATPVRQYDPDGTEAIFAFFGEVVFRFTMDEAIGKCLVPYDYHVHPVQLGADEMDEWRELSAQIKKNAWRQGSGKPDELLSKLLRDRRALLETASGKIGMLARLLDSEDLKSLRYTLIYASDKGPDQLNQVNSLLRQRGLLFHQLTAEETADRPRMRDIIRSFQAGELQVLTAKRVLDEGVNIPQICRAYVLASTTVERQWVQRRGRLLRSCRAIGKAHGIVHDLISLPPGMENDIDADARTLIKSELRRVREFAKLARNAGRSDGPLGIISKLTDAVAT